MLGLNLLAIATLVLLAVLAGLALALGLRLLAAGFGLAWVLALPLLLLGPVQDWWRHRRGRRRKHRQRPSGFGS